MIEEASRLKERATQEYWEKKALAVGGMGDMADWVKPELSSAGNPLGKGEISVKLPGETNRRIRQLCNQSDLLIFSFYLTAFYVLLYKYFRISRMAISSYPMRLAGEDQAAHGDKGYVFFGCQLDEKESFKQLFGKVKKDVLDVYTHQDIACSVLGEVMVPHPNVGEPRVALVWSRIHPLAEEEPKEDLMVQIIGKADDAELVGHFDRQKIHVEFLQLFLSNYGLLLDNILNQLYDPLQCINIMGRAEMELIQKGFNNTAVAFPEADTIPQYIACHASQTPDRVALVFEDRVLTYSKLHGRALLLSQYLRNHCLVSPEDLVAIRMEQSDEMAVSILAVWQCGAAYLPLNSSEAELRIRTILEESRVKVLLTGNDDPGFGEALTGSSWPGSMIRWQDFEEQTRELETPMVGFQLSEARQLAYVIHTSGSTGKPKGVMIEHSGMMNHLWAKIRDLALDSQSIVVQNASPCFDISVWQLWAALVAGGRTVIYPPERILLPASFIEMTDLAGVTVLEVVPSYLTLMLDSLSPLSKSGLFGKLRYLVVTGEELKAKLVNNWFDRFPGIGLVNAYGPTEASDDITHYFMVEHAENDRIPIGKALSNFRLYIVNDHEQLCPVGAKGEIWVSGAGVGRGYLNDPEQTIRSFGIDPFCSFPSERLYKTGDLGRYLPNGCLEFFGRKDQQVKIRGFRVELQEVEHALLRMPEVQEGVVVWREKESETACLCAYLKLDNREDESTLSAIKLRLQQHLPPYMIPDHWMVLQEFPLTFNGKVDRKALPLPSLSPVRRHGQVSRLPTEMESRLIRVWEAILKTEAIGVTDHFFEKGGHSLNAIQMLSRLSRDLGVDIPLKDLFMHPTVEQLAVLAGNSRKQSFRSIGFIEEQEYYPLTDNQKRVWIIEQLGRQKATYNIPLAYQLSGEIDPGIFEKCLESLVERHEILRTRIITVNGDPKQRVLKNPREGFVFLFKDLTGMANQEVMLDELAAQEVRMDFALQYDPLVRVRLLRVDEQRYICLFTLHHIISDEWSEEILMKEFFQLYAAFLNQRGNPLPALSCQYKDYTAWQAARMREEKAGYRQPEQPELFGPDTLLDLPYHDQYAEATWEGDTVLLDFGQPLGQTLRQLSTSHQASMYMLLMAAIKILLFRYTNAEKIRIGSPVSGRNHADLNNQVGFYTRLLLIQTQLLPEQTYLQVLQRVKDNFLKSYDLLDNEYGPGERSAASRGKGKRTELFEIGFTWYDVAIDYQGVLHSVPFKVEEWEQRTSKKVKAPLWFRGFTRNDALVVALDFDKGLFKKDTMEKMLTRLKSLVSQFSENPNLKLIDFLLDEGSKKQVLPAAIRVRSSFSF